MKSEERHKLEHNYVADQVEASIEHLAPYGKQLAAALAVVLVIVFGWQWYSGKIRSRDEKAWEAYMQAMSMRSSDASGGQNLRRSKLQEVVSNGNFASSPAVVWARLSLADDELERGIDRLFENRTEGEKELEKSKEDYQAALKAAGNLNAKHSSVIVPRAMLGHARALESLGDVKDALAIYKDVEAKFAVTAFKSVAQRRVAALSNEKAENFYDWLREQDIRPQVPSGRGEPGLKPDFDPFGNDPFGKNLPTGLDLEGLKIHQGETKKEPAKEEPPKGETKAETKPEAKSDATPAGEPKK